MQSLLGGNSRGGAPGTRRARGAAPIVGVVLMLGIVVTGASIVYVAGMDAKASVQDASRADSAEATIQEAGATFSSLAHDGGDATDTVEFGTSAGDVDVDTNGQLRVQLNGRAACAAEMDLGTVVAKQDSGTEVAYQAGAVFRKSRSGTTIVQSPRLEYRTKSMNGEAIRTVSFPVTNVSGDVRGAGDVVASANASDSFQDDLCLTDSAPEDFDYVRSVTITIEGSDYYEAWYRYFQEEFPAEYDFSIDDSTKTASVSGPLGKGVSPNQFIIERFNVYGAIYSTTSSGELLLQTKHASIDSYDAEEGLVDGEPTYRSNGNVFTRGDISVQANNANISGNVYAEGTVKLDQSCGSGGDYCVEGAVYVNNSTAGPDGPTTNLTSDSGNPEDFVSGETNNGTALPSISTMDATIEKTIDAAGTWNTNEDTDTVSSEQIQYSGTSATLDTGVYYLSDLTVPEDHTLEFDTSDGDVVLVLEDDVTLENGATVTVKGDGRVNTYIGEDPGPDTGDQLSVGEGVTVQAVDDDEDRTYRAEAFMLACKAGCNATFSSSKSDPTTFTGVLYGPGNDASDGTVYLDKHVEVWGALVGGTVTFQQQSEFHFDESLRNREADRDGDGVPDPYSTTGGGLTYVDLPVENGYVISVTKHDVNVTDDSPKSVQSTADVARSVAPAGDGAHAVDVSPAVAQARDDATRRQS
jgi:hypothetical protein